MLNTIKNASKSKILKVNYTVCIVILVIIVEVGLLLLFDYISYRDGHHSHFFGTLNTYSQNQTLHNGNLDVKASNLKLLTYNKDDLVATENSCLSAADKSTKVFLSKFPDANPYNAYGNFDSLCGNKLNDKNITANEFANSYKLVEIPFVYQNIGNTPIRLKQDNFRIEANTSIYNLNDAPNCHDIFDGSFIKGSPLESCLHADIDKNYVGPLALTVTINGKTKQITFNITK